MSQGMVAQPSVGQAASLPVSEPLASSDADAAHGASGGHSPPHIVRPDPLFHIVLLGLCATILVLAVVLSVRGGSQVVLPVLDVPLPELCMLKRYTGLSCPGCGLTRSFIALGHGDLPAAMAYNPAGVLLFGVVAIQIPLRGYQIWRIRQGLPELTAGIWGQAALLAFVIALLGQWTMRLIGVTF